MIIHSCSQLCAELSLFLLIGSCLHLPVLNLLRLFKSFIWRGVSVEIVSSKKRGVPVELFSHYSLNQISASSIRCITFEWAACFFLRCWKKLILLNMKKGLFDPRCYILSTSSSAFVAPHVKKILVTWHCKPDHQTLIFWARHSI